MDLVSLGKKLAGFRDLVIADGTLVRLHDSLANVFPGVKNKAELKVHAVISVVVGGPKTVRLISGKTAEAKTLRLGPGLRILFP